MKVLSKLTPSFLIICCLIMGFSFQIQAQMIGGTVGSIAPNIELPDQYGNKVSLSGLRGNLVLVRFWKSGDPNSRATNANIHALHQKYKNASFKTAKGFEVFMVSLDSRLDKWKMALQQDQLPQNYHVNDIYSKFVAPYGVNALPANFLLDENGVIVANTKSMAELDRELSNRANVYASTSTTTVIPNTTPTPTTTTPSQLMNTSDRPSTFNQATTTMTNVATTYMIQLGAFKNWDMNKFLDASEYGFVTAEDAGNGVKRALLGKFSSTEDAVSTLSKVRNKGYADAFVVAYQNNARKVLPSKEVSDVAAKIGIKLPEAPVSTKTSATTGMSPATMNIATTTIPSTNSANTSGHYEIPFSTVNTDNNPITSIPDESISHTYHNNGSVVSSTTTEMNGNIATYNAGSTVTSTSTLVPSEIPVFTGGVNPATHSNGQGTYYDSDAYELSWYPSEPSTAQPNIIESPYYNTLPQTNNPNANNNNSGSSDWKPVDNTNNTNPSWNTNNNNDGWSDWKPVDNTNNTTTDPNGNNNTNPSWNTNNNSGWNNNTTTDPNWHNNTQQPTMDGQWNNGQPNTNTYPQPNDQELEQSLNSYLNSYDFSSVDDNSEKLSDTKKKKKKRKKNKKKKR